MLSHEVALPVHRRLGKGDAGQSIAAVKFMSSIPNDIGRLTKGLAERAKKGDLAFCNLVDKVAAIYRDTHNDPYLGPHVTGQPPDWATLRDVADRALAWVGSKISTARTEADAHILRLQSDKYEDAAKDIERRLRAAAVRLLAEGVAAMPQVGRYSGFVGFGRREPMADLEIMPQLLWESGTLDWQRLQFTADDGAKWSGVRFIDMSDFSTDEIERLIDEGDERTPIATPALRRFLEGRVASLPAGSPFLAEQHLLMDAKQAFPRNNITRLQVRQWIKDCMPPDKKKPPHRPKRLGRNG
jgi:hypothetical protein